MNLDQMLEQNKRKLYWYIYELKCNKPNLYLKMAEVFSWFWIFNILMHGKLLFFCIYFFNEVFT